MAEPSRKAPAFQWYPGDFRRDTAVQACSFEARALWREMIDLMHDGEPRGYLTAGGAPIEVEQLARIVGQSRTKVGRWLTELEERKVFSRTADGTIYSRRMVRDEHVTQVRRNAGRLGGNPDLIGKRDHPEHNPEDKPELKQSPNQNGKQKPTPAAAAAVASASATAPSNPAAAAPAREFTGLGPLRSVLETDADRTALDAVLAHVPTPKAWYSEMTVALDGMHGPAMTPRQIGEALRDYVGNGKHLDPELITFRGYLRRAARKREPSAPPTSRRPSAQERGRQNLSEAMIRRAKDRRDRGEPPQPGDEELLAGVGAAHGH